MKTIEHRVELLPDGKREFVTVFPSGEVTRSDSACIEPGCLNADIAGYAKGPTGSMVSAWICHDHASKYECKGWGIILA